MKNKDKGLELLSFTLQNIKSKKSFGTKGKVFEDLVKSSLETNNFNKCSFKQNDPLFIGNNLSRNKNDLKKTIEKVKEFVLNKSNIEPIPNLFKKHFDYNNDIYIYIYISTFWFSAISWFSFNYKRLNNSFGNKIQ